MLKDFRSFILRGNVVDLAIGIVMGSAFTALIGSFVKNLLTPLITIPGKTNFASLHASVHHSIFNYGDFLNQVISFLILGATLFFFVVKPVNALMNRRRTETPVDPAVRDCPQCLSSIPVAANRCAFCTSEVGPTSGTELEPAPAGH
jgi:large conductance mechanosensitive channel